MCYGKEKAMRRLSFAFLILVIAGALAMAEIPLRAYWGERVKWHNARDLAFAGMNRFDPGPGAVFSSPAQLGFVDRPGLELSYGLKFSSEQRTRTVYDRFENTIGEAVVADNAGLSGIVGPLAGVFPLFGKGAVAAGIGPVLDFSYRYYKEFRDDFYNVIGEDRVEQTGTVFNAGLGFGFRPLSRLSLGASGGYMFGSRELESWQIRIPDTSYESEFGKPAGVTYAVGIAGQPIDRLDLEFGFTGPVKLSGWYTPSAAPPEFIGCEQHYPWRADLNVSYQVPGPLPSRVMLEAEYQPRVSVVTGWGLWGKHPVTETASILSVRAGVEHTMLNFLKLRYGFGVEPLSFDPSIQLAEVGAGVGFDAGFGRIDIGGMFFRDVIGPSYFYGSLTPKDQTVYETSAVFAVTVEHGF